MARALFIPAEGFKGQETTREAYTRDLGYLEKWLDSHSLAIEEMTEKHWDQFVELRGWGYKGQRRTLSAARYWLRKIAEITTHPIFEVDWPQGSRKPQRTLKLSQRDELLEAAGNTRNAERDRALILLMWDIGARKFEVSDARWENIDLQERSIYILTKAEDLKPRHWELKRFSPVTSEALMEWRRVSTNGGGSIFGLSREGISSVFKRLSAKVGFRVSPHDLRRGAGAYMAENGISDRLAMKQFGIKTHAVYQNYSEAAELKALDGLWK